MPKSSSGPLRITVLADSDTRWKWGALTARRISSDVRLDARLLRGRATPTSRQLAEIGIPAESMREVTAAEFLSEAGHGRDAEGGCDVVVLACVGGTVQAMLHGLARAWEGSTRRPVVVTGYVGVVYEKLADGLLLRAGADVVLANSAHDAQRFRDTYAGVGADTAGIVETALPFLEGAPYRPSDERPFTVTFAVQPSAPEGRTDRTYLARRAVEHARRHPEREVLVKLRSKPGEHTTHIEEHPYQKLVAKLGPPDNLRLVYGHMGEVLDRTDLLVTVSSTAALESLHRSVPTAVLTDLGIRESLGNHHFLGSGCFASWDQLDEGHVPQADPGWLAAQGVASEDPFGALRERVTTLVAAGELPPPAPYYTPLTAPGYLPGVLARHGLDAKGEPLPGAVAEREPSALRRALRDAARNSARTAYRQGVQRVAPVIRRWGQL
ncbi:hypothetical protein G3I60_33280 [Streptomyces sp. SID13666]|uniref:DUF6716 putative glycosyltransferase n=1 Tax=unclassified Streptomyces TaxID=2593676 RepID=UPI0013C25C06|nr:DUF6716 putative glycosyltransferase [Streptomyces sp. H39-C1]MCZ4099626.1 hypothetical protein [Streptomyces sp. H39-C1]NEA58899.1 hypothetical protein [Streptomyces sp. SID13666]NEA72959.1 hypothetical protein [Streptomyces sp. SID13588]